MEKKDTIILNRKFNQHSFPKLYIYIYTFRTSLEFTIETRVTFIYTVFECLQTRLTSARQVDTIHSACHLVHDRIDGY